MKNKVSIICFLIMPVLYGCNDKIYDVSYYKEHKDVAIDISLKCKGGEVADDNCKNANEALRQIKSNELFKKTLK
ncbi:TPA: EexN family lipoprotein [Enterobacter chuandaensis]|nr:EexN family lipoprotein [Enterobacter chuandaensis]